MIIARYLSKQILLITSAVTFLLLIVVVLGRLLKYLAQASQGELDPGVLILLMSYRLPDFLQLILPLALLLAILLAYGRMYADSEMTVLIACGLSKVRLFGLTLISSTIVAILVGFLCMKVTPWGLLNTATLLEAQKNLNEFDLMLPGQFQNISRGVRTTYTENIAGDELQNVFMHETENNRVTVARVAIPGQDESGERFVLFKEGSITEGLSGENEYTLTNFTEMGVRLPQRELSFEITLEEKAMPTLDLLSSGESSHIAEFQWRVSLILLIPIITLMAIPLSRVSPRQGRFARMVPAILIYIFYFALLLASRDKVESGELSSSIGLWWVHALFLMIALLLFFEKLPSWPQWSNGVKSKLSSANEQA